MRKIKIGIVGCGAIGRALALMLEKRFKNTFKVVALCDIDRSCALRLKKQLSGAKVLSLKGLIEHSDLVVEAASGKVSFEVARASLLKKRDVMIMSIGGILGREKELFKVAQRSKRRIYFPSGAICGLDGIRALAPAGIEEITLRTLKPPQSFKGAPYIVKRGIDLDKIKKQKVIFRGSAREAVKAFPQNINVVALLSIAAKGLVSPRVEIVAVPGLKKNIHTIDVVSRAARLKIRCENIPSPDNPKTSYLAVLSAAQMLGSVADMIRIGS